MKYPHNHRFFSATLFWQGFHLLLIGGLGVVVGLNALLWFDSKSVTDEVAFLLSDPWSPTSHERFARALWTRGQSTEAIDEMRLAQDLVTAQKSSNTDVLGTTSYDEVSRLWAGEKQQRQKELTYWEKVVADYPTYRDAFIALGALSLELGNTDEATHYLQKAQALDPYKETTISLQNLLIDTQTP